MSDKLMTIKETCDYLNIAKPTLYLHARAGKIPAVKVGKKWRFDKKEIKDFLKKQRRSYLKKKGVLR